MRVIERKFITLGLHNEALRQCGKSLSKNTNKSLEFIPSCLKRLIKEYKYSGKHHILSDNQPHVCFALMCSGLRDKLLRWRILKLVQAYELPSMRTSFMRFFYTILIFHYARRVLIKWICTIILTPSTIPETMRIYPQLVMRFMHTNVLCIHIFSLNVKYFLLLLNFSSVRFMQ